MAFQVPGVLEQISTGSCTFGVAMGRWLLRFVPGGGWPLAFPSDLVMERWWVPPCCLSPFLPQELINKAINAALAARKEWDLRPVQDRAQIFLKAADMLSGPRRAEVLAKTMIGQVRAMQD